MTPDKPGRNRVRQAVLSDQGITDDIAVREHAPEPLITLMKSKLSYCRHWRILPSVNALTGYLRMAMGTLLPRAVPWKQCNKGSLDCLPDLILYNYLHHPC